MCEILDRFGPQLMGKAFNATIILLREELLSVRGSNRHSIKSGSGAAIMLENHRSRVSRFKFDRFHVFGPATSTELDTTRS